MAILDASPFQTWMTAFDNWDRAQRRYNAAGQLGNQELVAYLRPLLDQAERAYHAAVRGLKT